MSSPRRPPPATLGSRSAAEARPEPARRLRYERHRDLPGLIAVWPTELRDTSLAARQRLLAKLRRALRAERRRGLAGHWTYDLARHSQLLAAYRAEEAELLRHVDADAASGEEPG
jgi:hypothetical protein